MIDFADQRKKRIALASAQQRMASNPLTSVWVEASAGTGKTKVLSDRVLRLLLDGVLPSRILCLTYTKAAAVEMNNRIAEKLSKWAVAKDEKLTKDLSDLLGKEILSDDKILLQARRLFALLLDTPGGVKIQTIHSFCQEILKRFPLEAKISPYFEVMDDRSSKDALDNIKKEILNEESEKEIVDALTFLTSVSGEYKFPKVMESITLQRNMIEDALERNMSKEELIDKISLSLNIEKDLTLEQIQDDFWKEIADEKLGVVIKALDCGSETTAKKAICLAKARDEYDFESFLNVFLTEGKPRKKLLVKQSIIQYPSSEEYCNEIMQKTVKAVERIRALNLFLSSKAVLILAGEMLKKYHEYKKKHSKLDYNDLIVITKNLFASPKVADWILYKLDGGIDNILIDEAQDTSPEQWAIVKSITKEFFSGEGSHEKKPTIFVVGDRKQSIYSFQGADPAEFEKMHHYFENKADNFKTVNMEVSFRSTAAILDTVNTVFDSDMAKSGVVKEGTNIAHIPSRIGDGGRVELWELMEADEDDKSDKIWLPPVERIAKASPSAKLAAKIAETIKEKVSNGELLKSKGRPLQYGDFLILVQRRNSFVEEMVRACKNIGVNIAGVDKIKLQDQIAVNDLIALAKFTLLKEDDLNLACLLKSPLIALDDDDLFRLCFNRGKSSLWERICDDEKYEKQARILKDILQKSKEVRPFELFSYVLSNLEGRKKFVERLGKDCEDAIDEFVNLTLDFEREHIPVLQLFVEWFEADEVEIKRDLEQNDNNAVRLMTVHGSKGLQAPIVILPDTTRVKGISKDARWFKDGELLLYPLSKDCYTEKCCNLVDEEKRLALEEYHRLLYVAITRAEECLCVCGYKKKNKPNEESWYELFKNAFSSLGVEEKDGVVSYNVEQLIVPEKCEKTELKTKNNPQYSWLKEQPKTEDVFAKPLTPSHQDEDKVCAVSPLAENNDGKLYARGRLIHKMLQFLPTADSGKREALTDVFLERQAQDFSAKEKTNIKKEVLALLNNEEFSHLFSTKSVAEVSLMGVVGENIVSGQIDRLVVCDDKVMIVDYKTNRPAAKTVNEIPLSYIKQMKLYKELVKQIYPDKKIEAYILWTNTAKIMKLDNI
ncbi:MAG: double-strand break repair helicase AddA [Alphaproteobacteria bacterium]|nr:double-strand break repair helicase AddA [Alphaproteobacteria bacterium]